MLEGFEFDDNDLKDFAPSFPFPIITKCDAMLVHVSGKTNRWTRRENMDPTTIIKPLLLLIGGLVSIHFTMQRRLRQTRELPEPGHALSVIYNQSGVWFRTSRRKVLILYSFSLLTTTQDGSCDAKTVERLQWLKVATSDLESPTPGPTTFMRNHLASIRPIDSRIQRTRDYFSAEDIFLGRSLYESQDIDVQSRISELRNCLESETWNKAGRCAEAYATHGFLAAIRSNPNSQERETGFVLCCFLRTDGFPPPQFIAPCQGCLERFSLLSVQSLGADIIHMEDEDQESAKNALVLAKRAAALGDFNRALDFLYDQSNKVHPLFGED